MRIENKYEELNVPCNTVIISMGRDFRMKPRICLCTQPPAFRLLKEGAGIGDTSVRNLFIGGPPHAAPAQP